MNLLTNAKAFLRMLTPLSILMFWACSIFASPIDTAILSPSFKNSETSIIVDDVCANPNVNVKGGANLIKIKGITTKSAAIQIFNSAWETVYNQQVSSDSVTVPNLAAGTYNVKVTVLQSGGKWPAVCSVLVNNVKVVTGVNPCNTDKQAPVFANCPQNINLTTSTTTAVAKWTPPTATDNCTTTPSVSSNYNSGFAFPIGSKTVTYTATDAKGNKATCNFTVNVAQTYNCRYNDSLALVDVYNTMGGANWVNKWDLTKPINTWAGIGTDSNGCVVALIPPSPIDKKNYPHKISPSISNLKSLQVLRLGNRNLIDTIPSSLDKLSNLKQFQFEENNLVGSIPSSFGNLVNLNSILGYNNKLTGLPSSLGNLPNLSELILFNNQFSGSVPASFSNLKTLSTLILHHNMLSGEIPKIPNLTSLDLSNNLYKDTLPFHLFDIKYSLNLSNNQFKGCIPNVYKALCGKQINLSNNPYLPNNGNFILFCENGTGNCESNKFCFNDTIQPYFTQCPSNIYLKTNTDTLIVNWIPPGAFDNCTTTPSVSSNITPNSKFLIGGTQVVYTAIDEKGNKGFCKFKIVVAKENCRQIDSLALVDLYNSTNGDLWQSAYKWDLKRPIDTWTGVKLNSDGCVKSFESWSLDLNGSLPQTIGNLTSIEVLIINASNLVGALPNSLSKLTSLDVLSIYNTQLTGTLSPTLGNLKSLRILQIGISNISGTIPNVLGDLGNLEELVLDRNKLTMGIPFELGKLSNLKILNLSENQLTGSVPASLSNLTNPNLVVNLGNNQLSGCLDPNLKKLCGKNIFIGGNPNLPNGGDWLAFCNTGFGGCDFNSCRNNDSLGLVALYNSTNGANWTNKWDLTKSINTWFGVTLSTKGCVLSINLQNNNLIGSIPSDLNFNEISILNLSENQLNGLIPNFNLPNLIELQLFSNQLSGSIPNFNLPKLSILWLYTNRLIGNIPNFNLPDLTILSLRENQLSGNIPNFNLPNLTGLSLRGNQLSGNIPNFNLPKLSFLYLYDNQLSGSIPDFNFPNLSLLWLYNNQLSGCIPTSLKRLCSTNVDVNISNNPNLPNGGDWAGFCNTGAGVCAASSDLALSISTINANYSPYTTVNFKIKVENKGSNSMTAIKIRFAYPPQTVNGGGATPSVGTWTEYCSGGILCYEWTIPTLDANAVATLDVPLFILATTSPIVANVNLLNSTPVDTEVNNNTATVSLAPPASPAQFLATPKRPKPSQYIPIVIQTVAPNPTEGDVLIGIESIVEKEVRFDFYNTLGKIVKSETRVVKKGENYLQFDFWNAQNGIYFIQISEGQGRGVPLKFVKL